MFFFVFLLNVGQYRFFPLLNHKPISSYSICDVVVFKKENVSILFVCFLCSLNNMLLGWLYTSLRFLFIAYKAALTIFRLWIERIFRNNNFVNMVSAGTCVYIRFPEECRVYESKLSHIAPPHGTVKYIFSDRIRANDKIKTGLLCS